MRKNIWNYPENLFLSKALIFMINTFIILCYSAGVGRTGVFITLSIVLERMRYEGVVDMFQTVKMLRTQRPAMVQTEVRNENTKKILFISSKMPKNKNIGLCKQRKSRWGGSWWATSSGSTMFALLSLNSQWDLAWTKGFWILIFMKFCRCKFCCLLYLVL